MICVMENGDNSPSLAVGTGSLQSPHRSSGGRLTTVVCRHPFKRHLHEAEHPRGSGDTSTHNADSTARSFVPVFLSSQWIFLPNGKPYSCQRCKWDFLPLITNRNSALIASCWQSDPPNPSLTPAPCGTTAGATAEAAPGSATTFP